MSPLEDQQHPDPAEVTVPVYFRGKREAEFTFEGVAVGLTDNGFGFRSNDQQLGYATIEAILRQAFTVAFAIPGVSTNEIIGRILRVEACRYDPHFLYFGAAEFLQIDDVDNLALQTGLQVYPKHKSSRPVISRPPPPPGAGRPPHE